MDVAATHDSQIKTAPVDYQTDPAKYRHWRVAYEGPVATLTMDVNEDGGIRPGYKLKLNSYDLGVDIELHDAAATYSLRASGNSMRHHYQRQEPRFLFRREHLHARAFPPTPGR